MDFIEYHKSNGHSNLEILSIKARRDNLELENIRECETCTKHAVSTHGYIVESVY